VLNKIIIALTAAVALSCVPVATDALAAGHPGGHAGGGHAASGHAMGGHTMARHARGGHGAGNGGGGYYEGGGPIYDSWCDGYNGPSYGCPGYGVYPQF
jgi:hypothetical protein